MTSSRSTLFSVILGLLFLVPGAYPQLKTSNLPVNAELTGDMRCLPCHADIVRSYEQTSHRRTSQPATTSSVLGSFRAGENVLKIVESRTPPADPGLLFLMESRKDGLFETAVTGWGPEVHRRSERIDLVTGSGKRGQTYLYWQGDRLYELPVSYWTDGHRWINSPGYVDGTANFSRPVAPTCLECHATYIRPLSGDPLTNRYDRASVVPGITCDSCHSSASGHVRQETERRKDHQSRDGHIGAINPANLSRDLQVDLCAECHNGTQRESVAPAFSYVPGHPLQDYFRPLPAAAVEHPDVHGNQVGLLQRSKCYVSSPQMSCSTCHDVHASEQVAASYSSKCLSCHQWQSCGKAKQLGHDITKNCINCHMPVEATRLIVSETAGNEVRAKMRNHWIKVYAEVDSAAERSIH